MSHVKTMLQFGISGCLIAIGTLEYVRRKIHTDLLENGAVGLEGRKLFYSIRAAKDILGVPITERHPDTWNSAMNYNNGYETQMNVPVEGQYTKGYIHIEGKKNLTTGDWVLTGLSLKSEDLQTTMYSIVPPQE